MSSNTAIDASTATPSSSGAQRFLGRSLQKFFSHPILFLLPAMAITVLGMYSGFSQTTEYRSIGTLSVSSETFLGSLSDVRAASTDFDTAATATSRQFNELMQTDGFASLVASTADLDEQLAAGVTTLQTLRQTVYAAAAGDSLMNVIASSESPDSARLIAESAISTFKTWVTDAEISASNAAETLFDEQLKTYQVDVDVANEELGAYLLDHPAPIDDSISRDTAEQLEIERLNTDVAQAQNRLNTALDKREAARQATRESSADIDQRLQIVDPPGVAAQSTGGLKQLVTSVIFFGVLGSLVSLCILALATVLDRSILSVADLDEIGVPVLAVVPRTKELRIPRPKPVSSKKGRRAAVVST